MKIMTTEIAYYHDVIQGFSPFTMLKARQKSQTQHYIGANFLLCCLVEAAVGKPVISMFRVRLLSLPSIVRPSHVFFSSIFRISDKDTGFLSQPNAARGRLYSCTGRGRKVVSNHKQKVDILLQLFHHYIFMGGLLLRRWLRVAMMLSAGEKTLNNKFVVLCNV